VGAMFVGILTLAMPITIIGTNFTEVSRHPQAGGGDAKGYGGEQLAERVARGARAIGGVGAAAAGIYIYIHVHIYIYIYIYICIYIYVNK